MNYKELLSEMLHRVRISKRELARRTGKSPSGVGMLWRREGLRVGTLLQCAKAMGYEVVVRPQNYVRLMDEELLLDSEWDLEDAEEERKRLKEAEAMRAFDE